VTSYYSIPALRTWLVDNGGVNQLSRQPSHGN
jgi:hypothetical protein